MSEDILRAGRFITVDEGEYDSYITRGVYEVLRDFNPMEQRDEYYKLHPDQQRHYGFSSEDFLDFLVAQEILAHVDTDSLYLGAYACADRMRVWTKEKREAYIKQRAD